MSKPDPLEEKILGRIPWEILILSFLFALAVLPFFGIQTSLVVLSGGTVSALSFVWLKQSINRLLSRGKKKALGTGLLLYVIRLLLIIAIFFTIIVFLPKKLLAFAAGFSTMVLVFLAEAAIALSRLRQWKS